MSYNENYYFNNKCNCQQNEYPDLTGLWSQIPYPEQYKPYLGIDPSACTWPTFYFNRNCEGSFISYQNKPIIFQIADPITINFKKELKEVENVQKNLTQTQKEIATYWGTGVPTQQWTPICLNLINKYKITPPASARLLACMQNVMNDAFIITWGFKYYFDCPRPCQLNRNLKTYLATPKFPTYPSGHSVVSGAMEIVLSYFFPSEKENLHHLAKQASISRLYGGIHFTSDLDEGLRLGRQIGQLCVEFIKTEYESELIPVD